MSVMDDVLEGKEPEQRYAEFCTKAELRAQWTEANAKAQRTRNMADARPKDPAAAAEADAAEQDLNELRARVQQHLLRFTFAPIGRDEFDALKGEHRPTEQQRTAARKEGNQPPEWNVLTFAPALVAASCVKLTGPSGEQDGLSYDEATAIFTSPRWNEAERAELFNEALAAYYARTSMDGVTLGNG